MLNQGISKSRNVWQIHVVYINVRVFSEILLIIHVNIGALVYFASKVLAFDYNGWVLEENMPCCALEVLQALIRDMLVFQQSPTKSYQIDVFFKHYVHIFGKFHCFLSKVVLGLLC